MPRKDEKRRKQLQAIINDPASTPEEIAEARRELAPVQSIPADAAGLDSDLEYWLSPRPYHPDDDREPPEAYFDIVTPLLGCWPDFDFAGSIARLKELLETTRSAVVTERAKGAIDGLEQQRDAYRKAGKL